jgi:hypothetical protein
MPSNVRPPSGKPDDDVAHDFRLVAGFGSPAVKEFSRVSDCRAPVCLIRAARFL